MGIFNSIFGKPESEWHELLKQNDLTEENRMIIKIFLIADNISFKKFHDNRAAFDTYQTHGKYFMIGLSATPSLEFAADPMNKGRLIPDWFSIAYPDVVKWMAYNSETIRKLYQSPYLMNDQPTAAFFRAAIQSFLKDGNRLECV